MDSFPYIDVFLSKDETLADLPILNPDKPESKSIGRKEAQDAQNYLLTVS
jgi:hypothetical protein